jgi:hypothetical protein
LTSGKRPTAIAAGPDGNLWFTESGGPGGIGRITPSGVITEFTAGLTSGSSPWAITAGADGNLWFTENFDPGRIGRITPSGLITEFSSGLGPGPPQDITSGPDGNVWFAQASNPGLVGRITPSGQITEFPLSPTTHSTPQGITAGPDGNLWFTERGGSGAIGRVTPSGFITEFTGGLTASAAPWGITTGIDGNVWFAENANPGRLGRLAITGSADTAGGPPASTPSPSLAHSIVAQAASGVVRVRFPHSSRFVRLRGPRLLPLGSLFDATGGKVRLTSAIEGGKQQSGLFWGSMFEVRQGARAHGLTDILLRGGSFKGCRRRATSASESRSSARRRGRKLWGRDHHGRFRTWGKHSVATVRGTRWLTADRCDGTLTRVQQGKVLVRMRHGRKRVLLRAGQSFLARAR